MMTVREAIDDAYSQLGMDRAVNGSQYRRALAAITILRSDWNNRQPNSWQERVYEVALMAGVSSYSVTSDTIGIVALSRKEVSTGREIELHEISLSEYQQLQYKTQPGKPTQFMVKREQDGGATLYVHPVPVDGSDVLSGWRLAGDIYATTGDQSLAISPWFLAAFVAGLAFELAKRNPKAVSETKMMFLKQEYEGFWDNAQRGDTHKSSIRMYEVAT